MQDNYFIEEIVSLHLTKGNCVKYLLPILFVITAIFAKPLKIVHPDNYYPYSFTDSTGVSQGILIDWWKIWADEMDTAVEFLPADNFSASIEAVKRRDADIIAGLFYTKERAESLEYCDYVIQTSVTLFVKALSPVTSIENLTDSVVVVEGDFSVNYLRENYPHIPLKVVPSFTSLMTDVKSVEASAFILDLPAPILQDSAIPSPKGYKKLTALRDERLRPAVRKGNRKLHSRILEGSGKIPRETLVKIAKRWNLLGPSRFSLLLIFSSLLAITVIILIVVLIKLKSSQKRIQDFQAHDWDVIIKKGESDTIEFKSSLRYDYRQECTNKKLELVIAKTVSAFLNSDGGILFIGVDDDGNTLGLEKDYSSLQKKNSDGFILALTNIINISLGKKCHHFINAHIVSLNDRDICIVSVEKSDTPVFFGKGDKEEFYIRAAASSQPLGLRETHEYIETHWTKRNR